MLRTRPEAVRPNQTQQHKKQDQVQNQGQHNQYAGPSQNLSQTIPPCERNLRTVGDPINVALWGWCEMSVPNTLEQMAKVLNRHRSGLIRDIYRRLTKPMERIGLGWGLLFASCIAQIKIL